MRIIIKIVFLLLTISAFSQQNINAKLVKADSLRARVDTLNLINIDEFLITVNDTLLQNYIGEYGGGGSGGVSFPLESNIIADPSYSFELFPTSGLGVLGNDVFLISDFILGDVNIDATGLGTVNIEGLSYPSGDGTAGQVLTTNGSGTLSFQDVGGGPTFVEGTYTPTLSNVQNATSFTASLANYYRVGNNVTIYGEFSMNTILPTSLTRVRISLPIPSNFIVASDAEGYPVITGGGGDFAPGLMNADAANNAIVITYTPLSGPGQVVSFMVVYKVN